MARLVGLIFICLFNVVFVRAMKMKCLPEYAEPKNGYLDCKELSLMGDKRCEAKCNNGYEFDGLVANYYICRFGRWWPICASDGPCHTTLPWPDCVPISGSGDVGK